MLPILLYIGDTTLLEESTTFEETISYYEANQPLLEIVSSQYGPR